MKYLFTYLGLLLIYSMLFPPQKVLAQEIHGSIDAFYQATETEREGEAKETTWNFSRGYFLGYKKAINPQMNYLFDFRATKNETDIQETTSLFNTGQFNVVNDIFNGNLGYQLMDRDPSTGSRITSNSCNLNLNSNLEEIPKFRFQYSQDKNYDHLDTHKIDNSGRQFSNGIQYNYEFIDMMFNYNQRETEDFVQDTVQESEGYLGRLDLHKSFWGSKLLLNSDFNWSRDTSKLLFKTDITLLEKRGAAQGLYLYDVTPAMNEMDEMTEMDTLIDSDYTTGTAIDIGSAGGIDHNIGVDLNISRECETIYLYIASENDPSFSNSLFTWKVYNSNDGINWSILTDNADFIYNTIYDRFEINFPSQEARYFKVVNTGNDDRSFVGSVYVTEIEILGSESRVTDEEDKTTSSRWGSNFMVTLRPLEKLSLGYGLSYDFTESDPASGIDSTTKAEISHGTNISYELNKYLSSSAQYFIRTSTSETSAVDERKNGINSFSLQFNSSPLTTFNAALSYNHSEAEEENTVDGVEEGKKESESNSYLLYMTAVLWEGVDASTNFHIIQSESSAGVKTTGQTINLDLRTKLTRNITLESRYNHNWQKIENLEPAGSDESSGLFFTLRYSPSSLLYMSADYTINTSENGSDSSYGLNMSWLPTEKIQLNFSSKFQRKDVKTGSYNLDFSWNISRSIIFKSGLNYSISKGERKDETRTFYTHLSARI